MRRRILFWAAASSLLNSYPILRLRLVKILIGLGAALDGRTASGETILHRMCANHEIWRRPKQRRQVPQINHFLDTYHLHFLYEDPQVELMMMVKNDRGRTPLDEAVLNHNVAAIEFLLQQHTGIDHLEMYIDVDQLVGGSNLLHFAVNSNCELLFKELLRHGLDSEDRNIWGQRPVHLASTPELDQLVDAGCNVNARTPAGDTALHRACRDGCEHSVRLLLQAGAVSDTQDETGKTPLHWACSKCEEDENSEAIIKMLLSHNANPFVLDEDDLSPFDYSEKETVVRLLATGSQHQPETFPWSVWKLRVLLESGLDPRLIDSEGNSLLHACCKGDGEGSVNKIEMIRHLAKLGLDPNILDSQGLSALHCEVESMDPSANVLKALVDIGANINQQDQRGRTALHKVCQQNGCQHIVNWLIRNGADIHAKDSEGNTALHKATCENIRHLINSGADVNARNKNGQTPLHLFFEFDNHAVGVCIGWDVPLPNLRGVAAREYQDMLVNTLEILVENGADPTACDDVGRSVLHSAAESSCGTEILSWLLQKGCQSNLADATGLTPLHLLLRSLFGDSYLSVSKVKEAIVQRFEFLHTHSSELNDQLDALYSFRDKSITTLLPSNFPVERGNPEGEQLIAYAQELEGLEGTGTLAFLEKNIFKPSTEHALAAP